MTSTFNEEPEQNKIVKKTIDPAPVPKDLKNKQIGSTYSWIVRLWRAIREYTVEDIGRLKEAGVSLVENKSNLKAAETYKSLAEVERTFAEAEDLRQAAALKKAQAKKVEEEAKEIRIRAKIEAFEHLSNAVSRIRQQGGEVAFNLEQLENLIHDGYKKYPEDQNIKHAAFETGVRGQDDEILRIRDVLIEPLDELELSVRIYNVLMAANIKTIGDLVRLVESELLRFPNLGRKSLQELTRVIEEKGIFFGMDVDKYLKALG